MSLTFSSACCLYIEATTDKCSDMATVHEHNSSRRVSLREELDAFQVAIHLLVVTAKRKI